MTAQLVCPANILTGRPLSSVIRFYNFSYLVLGDDDYIIFFSINTWG